MLILPLAILFIVAGALVAIAAVLFVIIKVSNSKKNNRAAAEYKNAVKQYEAAKANSKRSLEYMSYPHEPFKRDLWSHGASTPLGIVSVFAALAVFIAVIALVPFNSKYWTITDQAGTVTSVKTLTVITDSDDAQLTSNFVVTLDDKQEVIMDDPRVQNVKVGDDVNLKCTWEWVYAGKDKQNCQFAE